jgi:hypothetical protein
MQRIDDASKE